MQVTRKLVISCLPRTIWPIFSLFFTFCYYFTRLKPPETKRQNMRNWENISHSVLGTVLCLMRIAGCIAVQFLKKAMGIFMKTLLESSPNFATNMKRI